MSVTSFACLPYELRSHIWSLAAEPRKFHEVRVVWPDGHKDLRIHKHIKKKYLKRNIPLYQTTSTTPPSVMQVCRESRRHAPYQRAFTCGTDPRWTWVNFDLDVFCVTSIYDIRDIPSHQSDIQRLHIRTEDDGDWYESATNFNALRVLYEFMNLREIHIVLESSINGLMWGHIYTDWSFGTVKGENITFLDQATGLVLTAPQLKLVDDWRFVFSFDVPWTPPTSEDLSSEITYVMDDEDHLTLAQMQQLD